MPKRVFHAGVIDMSTSARVVYEQIMQSIVDREQRFEIHEERNNWNKSGEYSIFISLVEMVPDGEEPLISLDPADLLSDEETEKKSSRKRRGLNRFDYTYED